MQELISQSEAARILDVSVDTVDNYFFRGLLRRYKTPGGRNRYERQQVESLLSQLIQPRPAKDVKSE
jgi:predicted site-specific integrase-resolvase